MIEDLIIVKVGHEVTSIVVRRRQPRPVPWIETRQEKGPLNVPIKKLVLKVYEEVVVKETVVRGGE